MVDFKNVEELESLIDSGQEAQVAVGKLKGRSRIRERAEASAIFKTNVDLTAEMREDLAAAKKYLNVSQQAIIKMALLEFLQKHRDHFRSS